MNGYSYHSYTVYSMLRALPAKGKLVLKQVTYLSCMASLPHYFIQSEVSIRATCSKPDLSQNRFERGYLNAQHRFSTRFGEILQNKLHFFLAYYK